MRSALGRTRADLYNLYNSYHGVNFAKGVDVDASEESVFFQVGAGLGVPGRNNSSNLKFHSGAEIFGEEVGEGFGVAEITTGVTRTSFSVDRRSLDTTTQPLTPIRVDTMPTTQGFIYTLSTTT